MIIAISGKIGSGKDTVGKIIQALTYKSDNLRLSVAEQIEGTVYLNHDWKIKKFATKIKETVANWLGVTVEQLEDREFKEKTMEDLYKEGYITKDFYESLPDSP